MRLDIYTLIAVSASAATLFGLGLFLFQTAQRTFRGLPCCGASFLAFGIGSALVALRGTVPDWASIILPNAMLVAGLACMDEGLSQFVRGRAGHRRTGLVVVLLAAAISHHYSAVQPDLQARIVSFSLAMAVLGVLCARSVLDSGGRPRLPSQWFTALVCTLTAASSLLRAGLTMLHHPGDSLLLAGPIQTLSVLAYLIFLLGCAFGIAWMSVQRYEARLLELAERDPLTGLFNRRALEERARREVLLAQRTGRPLSLVLFDVDDFKAINDTHGHKAGDRVLQALARAIGQGVRGHDIVARYGGEEFLVLLPDTDGDRAVELAERLRQALRGLGLAESGQPVPVAASFGVASLGEPEEDWDGLVVAADRALYRAKQAGKNRVVRAGAAPA